MSAAAVALLAVYVAGWIIAGGIFARQFVRSDWGPADGRVDALAAFFGMLIGYIWPAALVFQGFAWVIRLFDRSPSMPEGERP